MKHSFLSPTVVFDFAAWWSHPARRDYAAILGVLSNVTESRDNSMRQLVVGAIFFAIGGYLLLPEAATSPNVSIWIRSIFSFDERCLLCCSGVFPRALEALVTPEVPLSKTGEQFCYFIAMLLDEFRNVFPQNVAEDVLTIPDSRLPITDYRLPIPMARISHLNACTFDVFRRLSQFLSRDDNLDVCSLFANSLLALIHARPPLLEVEPPGECLAMQFGPLAASETVLRFWPVKSMRLATALTFPPRWSVRDLINEAIIGTVDLISKVEELDIYQRLGLCAAPMANRRPNKIVM